MTFPNRELESPPRLLVSVRDADEALAALAGGADVIDVKEPEHGSLGAAEPSIVAEVAAAVEGRAPVTAALGEVLDWTTGSSNLLTPSGVVLVKFGLAGCGAIVDWRERWRQALRSATGDESVAAPRPVAVAYADWQTARAPAPDSVLEAGIELGCPALLIDTWQKSGGDLFCQWESEELKNFVERVRQRGLAIVLAGSLAGESFAAAVHLGPDIVAVRTAACEGGRQGRVTTAHVQRLKKIISGDCSGNELAIMRSSR